MNYGFVKLSRELLDTGLIKKHNAFIVYSYLLLKANLKPSKYVTSSGSLELNAGDLVGSISIISTETGLSLQSTRTALKTLESNMLITIKSTREFSVYSIVSYGFIEI